MKLEVQGPKNGHLGGKGLITRVSSRLERFLSKQHPYNLQIQQLYLLMVAKLTPKFSNLQKLEAQKSTLHAPVHSMIQVNLTFVTKNCKCRIIPNSNVHHQRPQKESKSWRVNSAKISTRACVGGSGAFWPTMSRAMAPIWSMTSNHDRFAPALQGCCFGSCLHALAGDDGGDGVKVAGPVAGGSLDRDVPRLESEILGAGGSDVGSVNAMAARWGKLRSALEPRSLSAARS